MINTRWKTMASRRIMLFPVLVSVSYLLIVSFFSINSALALSEPIALAPDFVDVGGSLVYPGSGDYVYALQGNNTPNFWRYSISQNKWESRASIPGSVGAGGSLVWTASYPNYIFALRGNDTNGFYRYSISGNSWTSRNIMGSWCAGEGSGIGYPGSGDYIYAIISSNSVSCFNTSTDYIIKYSIPSNNQAELPKALQYKTPSAGLSIVYPGTGVSLYFSRLPGSATGWNYDEATGTGSSYSFNTEFWRFNVLETLNDGWRGREIPPATMGVGAALGHPGKGNYIYAFKGSYTRDFWRYPYYVTGTTLFGSADQLQSPNPWQVMAQTPAGKPVGDGAALAGTGGDYLYAFTGGYSRDFIRYSIKENKWETSITKPNPPNTSINLNPSRPNTIDGWYSTVPVTVTLSRDKSGTTKYQWDSTSGSWTDYSTPITALTGDYTDDTYHTLYYYSQSSANPEDIEKIKFAKIKVDPNYPASSYSVPHGGYTIETELCASCHRGHTARAAKLLASEGLDPDIDPGDIELELCYVCHDGTGSKYNILAQVGRSPADTQSHHPVPEKVLKCTNCHDPHLSPSTNPRLLGATVTDKNGVKQPITGNNNSVCFACHPNASFAYSGSTIFGKTKHGSTGSSSLALTRWEDRSFDSAMCGNCHNPHGVADAADMRRKPKNEFCFTCHDDDKAPPKPSDYSYQGKTNYSSAAHSSSTNINTIWPNPNDTGAGLMSGGATPGECINCHNPHGKDDGSTNPFAKALMGKEENLCYGGSGGSGGCHSSASSSVNNINIYLRFSNVSSSMSTLGAIEEFFLGKTWKYTARHGIIDEDQALSGQKLECPSCHNPHLNNAANPVIDPDNKNQAWTGSIKDFCLKCHSEQIDSAEKIPYSNNFHGDKLGNHPADGLHPLNPPYFRGYGALPCTDCHDPHGSPNPYHLKEVINGRSVNYFTGNSWVNWFQFCGACHGSESNIKYAHKYNYACGNCHPSGLWNVSWGDDSANCMPCHAHNPRNIATDMTRGRSGGL